MDVWLDNFLNLLLHILTFKVSVLIRLCITNHVYNFMKINVLVMPKFSRNTKKKNPCL